MVRLFSADRQSAVGVDNVAGEAHSMNPDHVSSRHLKVISGTDIVTRKTENVRMQISIIFEEHR